MNRLIRQILDAVYPLFARLMPRQTFYYAACGGANTLLGLATFFISFHYVVRKQLVHLPFITISPHIMAMIISFVVSFSVGFYLNRYVVFSESSLRGRHQLMRYLVTSLLALLLNYGSLKLMVDQWQFYPTVAQILNTVLVISFSYLAQKHFAFHNRPR